MDYIEPNLYLGNWQDARANSKYARHDGFDTLCVIETQMDDWYPGLTHYIPILDHDEHSLALIPPRALIHKLDEACTIIDDHLLNHEPLLVHCWAGIERSPLTLAYWLVKSKRRANLDGAYRFLKHVRPIVEDRREWLPLSLASSL